MLVLTRRPGQAIRIDLMEGVDAKTPVGELFTAGAIEVTVTGVKGMQVKIGIRADSRFRVLREELCPSSALTQATRRKEVNGA